MYMFDMGKLLIVGGVMLIVFGLAFMGKLGPLGKLPGDISFSKGDMSFFFPITTSIILSVVISLIFWFMQK